MSIGGGGIGQRKGLWEDKWHDSSTIGCNQTMLVNTVGKARAMNQKIKSGVPFPLQAVIDVEKQKDHILCGFATLR